MKNILHVGLSSNPGGIEQYVLNVLKAIDKNEFSFTLLNISDEKIAHSDVFENIGAHIINISPRKGSLISHYLDLINLFRSSEYDIVEFHMMSYSWFEPILFARMLSGSKIIIHAHTTRVTGASLTNRALDLLGRVMVGRRGVYRVACTESAGKIFFRGLPFNVFRNTINFKEYTYSEGTRKSVRHTLGVEDKFVIGHIGTFSYAKNHAFLVEIMRELKRRAVNPELILVGEGLLKKDIYDMVRKNKLNDYIKVLDGTNDVASLMQAFDLFVLPSHYEGLGMVLIEAQASGLKCLASDAVPAEAKITKEFTFLQINHGVQPWADEIENAMARGYLRTVNKKQLDSAGYNIRHEINTIEKYYKKTIEGALK